VSRASGLGTLGLSLALLSTQCGACNSFAHPEGSNVRFAQFGVFFGGQVQQRLEIPISPDPSQNTQGLRVEFRRPLPSAAQITWDWDYPTARSGPRGPCSAPRKQRTETATVPAGADRFEQLLNLDPTSVPGTYNLRVMLGEEVALDRSFRVVRQRLKSED